MTCREKYKQIYNSEPEIYDGMCPDDFGYLPRPDYCYKDGTSSGCEECWNREIPEDDKNKDLCVDCVRLKMDGHEKTCPNVDRKFTETVVECDYYKPRVIPDFMTKKLNIPTIKDSGARREFETGAVRDIQEGKGRCDLLPLDVVAEYYTKYACFPNCRIEPVNAVLNDICEFQNTGNHTYLLQVLRDTEIFTDNFETAILEVSKHFEEGAKKYGEYNWQKGIPTHCYIDSAVRHYLKHLRRDKDEPHDRAFVWNILCCIWTCIHKPELNDYAKENKEKES